ncbi:MAG: SDR family NAD(P)-dependent oxidoreductase [Archangiaceae bacterium]|nr:SDR family NAD(P)-dependent oxidoreductase [Archangiaceae bacterium]
MGRAASSAVLVTGASSGIGLHIARALARRGAKVAFAARRRETLEREVAAVVADGGQAVAVPLDVTDAASAQRAVQQVMERFGRVDVLVNNAGNGGELGWWADARPEVAREQFAVHVLGAEHMARAVLPVMRAQRGGVIVNFASTVGYVPMPGAAIYSAAKAAVNAWSIALRTELAPENIDVRVFSPPHTSTEAGERWPLALPKIFEPAWVAEAFVSFLDSNAARALPGGNGGLLLLQRVWPSLAARIMNGLGRDAVTRRLEHGTPKRLGNSQSKSA